MDKATVKLSARYVVLVFFLYLAHKITEPTYAVAIKDVGEIAVGAIYTSVFGALTFILKSHFETKIDG